MLVVVPSEGSFTSCGGDEDRWPVSEFAMLVTIKDLLMLQNLRILGDKRMLKWKLVRSRRVLEWL